MDGHKSERGGNFRRLTTMTQNKEDSPTTAAVAKVK